MNVLIVAAHPDDEVLGCGATIAKHTKNGDTVYVLILAEGITSRDRKRNRDKRRIELSNLAQAAQNAAEILGVASLSLHQFPDNKMDTCNLLDVVKVVEQSIQIHKPEIIYTHHCGDLNIDHRYAHEAVVTAARPVPDQTVRTLLFFEVSSSTEWRTPNASSAFIPNWFVDVADTLPLKIKALEAYNAEMSHWPHARSINAAVHMARWRGACVGVEAAESFVLGRRIEI